MGKNNGSVWNDARKAELAALIASDIGAQNVVTEINKTFGTNFTKNAIIAAADRYGFPWPRSPKNTRPPSKAQKAVRTARARNKLAEGPPVAFFRCVEDTGPVRLLRSNNCHWPIGDPRSPKFCFCLRKSIAGIHYCGLHARIAYKPRAYQAIIERSQALH